MKVTVVGAGNVGATVANVLATKAFCSEVVLVDIKEGVPEGKAIDIMQTAHMLNFDTTVKGVTALPDDPNGYAPTAGSEVVVITSGMPRKPGMSREDLIGVNAKIVKSVVDQALKFSPDAYFIIISNPMDAMTYLALKDSGLPRNRILGQGGMLDSSRFRYYLSVALTEAGYPATPTDIDGMVLGGHSDKTMVPLVSHATLRGVPVTQLLSKEALTDVVEKTKVGGATLTKLLGTSAWMAPGAAAAMMVERSRCEEAHSVLRRLGRRVRREGSRDRRARHPRQGWLREDHRGQVLRRGKGEVRGERRCCTQHELEARRCAEVISHTLKKAPASCGSFFFGKMAFLTI